ncbi:MAG: class I SAM-dependent methyltransferase [Flavobacteriaceae bacterium]|jgi:SAM-dependent methyltransferase|nr:methyltransferase domain-containing protein [Formosa sp.]MDG2497895.1 class I SAM-dependent methyltransferase [Flavobacteriaceae bacterium]
MTKEHPKWFQSWFDTSYYHLLYKHRNFKEAEFFIKNIVAYLNLEKGDSVLDLACGKGRHSIFLNSLGFHVTGLDLSKNSIEHAKTNESNSLHFKVHDMRDPFKSKFEVVFNLFTSFGYFEKDEDNFKVIQTIKSSLKHNGIGVIDFMNSPVVIDNLVAHNTYEANEVKFELKRNYKNGFITKDIQVKDAGKTFHFKEKVRAYTFEDFEIMLSNVGLHLLDCFGSYKLDPFNIKTSERLILIFMAND